MSILTLKDTNSTEKYYGVDKDTYNNLKSNILKKIEYMSLEQALDFIKDRIFYHEMKDRWNRKDYIYFDVVFDIKNALEKIIKKEES